MFDTDKSSCGAKSVATPTARYWYAHCSKGSGGGGMGHWSGPRRASYAEADEDARAHQAATGHNDVGVLGFFLEDQDVENTVEIIPDDASRVNGMVGQNSDGDLVSPICGLLVRDGSQKGKARYRGVGVGRVSAILGNGTWIPVSIYPNYYYLIPHTGGWNCFVPPRR